MILELAYLPPSAASASMTISAINATAMATSAPTTSAIRSFHQPSVARFRKLGGEASLIEKN